MEFQNSLEFAGRMDDQDPLREYRNKYHFPQKNGKDAIYLCGNSLGLQPKTTKSYLEQELKDWADLGVEGHLKAKRPWLHYHHLFSEKEAKIVGALPEEMVVMNTLTANLHFLMVSFYRPAGNRFKIMVEGALFPSDHYAVESQIRYHGFDPEEGIIELTPRAGEHTLRTDDILDTIDRHGDELALILIGGVNYYTGQFFDLEKITVAGHRAGAMVGFDLAHAAGNVIMRLHDWNVDFAAWCTYKYLNSGPGGPGGVFIHEKHHKRGISRFAGWWGYEEETRFEMKKWFKPMEGAAAWQLSNAPVLGMAAHLAALDLFDEVGMDELRNKSKVLTGFLEFLIREPEGGRELDFEVITPADPVQRGCQISLLTGKKSRKVHEQLAPNGVIADWREPDVIRVAPVPMYNSYEDVFRFAEIVKGAMQGM